MPSIFRKPHLAAALLATLLSPAVHAEAVTNGGFNTGNLSGWTFSGDASTECSYAVSGPCSSRLRSFSNVTVSLSQTLATVAGATYSYSFWLDHGAASEISFTVDGDEVYGLHSVPDTNGFSQVTGSFVAGGAATAIAFNLSANNQSLYIDEVSITGAIPTAGGVPEPASLLLAGTALAGLGAARRRVARRAAA